MNTLIIDNLSVSFLRRSYLRFFQLSLEKHNAEFISLYLCKDCGLKFFYPIWTGDEAFYEGLQRFPWYYLEEKQEYKIAKQYITSVDHVLEIGAGKGIFASKISCASYTGLEFSKAAVQMAQKQSIQLYRQSIEEHVEQQSLYYDVVCSFQVLEHVADIYKFVEASIRSLKIGGKLIFSVPNDSTYIGLQVDHVLNMPPHHVSRWTDSCLHQLANEFKLRVINTHYDKMDEREVPLYARCLVQTGIRELLGRSHSTLDPFFQNLFVKAAVKAISIIPKFALRNKQLRPFGHSVTIVYEKL
jgi:2-polyprenyl-3-methyl-5-hydroxy-6-metoxy-1,4-benzoquinol methylase